MRSQTLPWFVINIIGTMTFIIILIVIITMQKNFYMTIKSLDDTTARMLIERELIVSPNCLAHMDVKYVFHGGDKPHYSAVYAVQPGVIDYYKLNNFYNINCMRYDLYYQNKVTQAYWITVYDLKNGNSIYYEREPKLWWWAATSFVYKHWEDYNCNDTYHDVIPVSLYKDGVEHPALLYLTICSIRGNGTTRFCEVKS